MQQKISFDELLEEVHVVMEKLEINYDETGEEFETLVFNHAKAIAEQNNATNNVKISPNIGGNASFTMTDMTPYKQVTNPNRLDISYYNLTDKADYQKLAAIYQSAYPGIEAIVTDFITEEGKVYLALSFSADLFARDVLANLKNGIVPKMNIIVDPETVISIARSRQSPLITTKSKISANPYSSFPSKREENEQTTTEKPQEEQTTCILQ